MEDPLAAAPPLSSDEVPEDQHEELSIVSSHTSVEGRREDSDDEEEETTLLLRTVSSSDPPGSVLSELPAPLLPADPEEQASDEFDQHIVQGLVRHGYLPKTFSAKHIGEDKEEDEEQQYQDHTEENDEEEQQDNHQQQQDCELGRFSHEPLVYADEECPSPEEHKSIYKIPSAIHQEMYANPSTPDTEASTPPCSPANSNCNSNSVSRAPTAAAIATVPRNLGSSWVAAAAAAGPHTTEKSGVPSSESLSNHSSTMLTGKTTFQAKRSPQPTKSLRYTPTWMLVSCAFLLVAVVGVSLYSIHTIIDLNGEIDSYETSLSRLGDNTTSWVSKALSAEETNGSLEAQVSSLTAEKDALLARVLELEGQVGTMEQTIDDLEGQVGTMEQTIEDLEGQVGTMEQTIDVLNSDVQVLEQTIDNLNSDVQVLEQTVANLEEQNSIWQALHNQMTATMEELNTINNNLNSTRLSLEASMAGLTTQYSLLMEKNVDCNETRLMLLDQITNFTLAVQALETHNDALNKVKVQLQAENDQMSLYTIPSLNNQLQKCSSQLNSSQNQVSMCNDYSEQLERNIDALNAAVTALEADNITGHTNHAICLDEKATVTSNLATCQEQTLNLTDKLSTCQGQLTTCSNSLYLCEDNFSSCDSDRTNFRDVIVPDLKRVQGELQDKVLLLEAEIDSLEDLNAIYFALNEQLKDTIQDYQVLTDNLNTTKTLLEQNVLQLNDTIFDLQDVQANLTEQLQESRNLSASLNETKNSLTNQVLSLTDLAANLTQQNAQLNQTIHTLNGQVATLENTRAALQQDVADLQAERQTLTATVDLLEIRIDELKVFSSYINDTSAQLSESYDVLLTRLASHIQLNRELARRDLMNHYADAIYFWDCAVYSWFHGYDWLLNRNMVISSFDIIHVLDFVEDELLNVMCLSRTDFEAYMADRYGGLDSITWDNIKEGTKLYADAARTYYFPIPGDPGLTDSDWEAADYMCENVAPFWAMGQ